MGQITGKLIWLIVSPNNSNVMIITGWNFASLGSLSLFLDLCLQM